MAVLHRAHTSGFCSALEQLPHSVSLLLSPSAAASSVLGIWNLSLREAKSSRECLRWEHVVVCIGRELEYNRDTGVPWNFVLKRCPLEKQ